MSYFGNALQELLNRKKMKAVRLAELSRVGQPTISRLINGDQLSPSPEDFENIARALTSEPEEQAELLRAHLLDERRGPGSELINITVVGFEARESAVQYDVKLPEPLERAFIALRAKVVLDKDWRDTIEGLGNLAEKGDCRTAAELLHEDEASSTADADLDEEIIRRTEADLGLKKTSKKRVRQKPSPQS
jgi:transcriptional regulator with XRE-family HTH domain